MSDFNVTFEENDQHITLDFKEAIGTVQSVNGKIGDVVLDPGDLEYDDTETYSSGSVGDELSTLKEDLSSMQTATASDVGKALKAKTVINGKVTEWEFGEAGGGLSEDVKQALLQIAEKVVYADEDGQDYYDALYDALYPPADLVSISAVYTQGGTVYVTDTLDSLKSDLVVTAHMSDSTTRTVTTYALSGTLTVGTSTITVSYGGKTTTFNVTVARDNRIKVYKGKGVSGTSIVDNPSRALSEMIDVTGATQIVTQWAYSETQDSVKFTTGDTTVSSEGVLQVPESYIGTSTAAGSYDSWRSVTSNLVYANKSSTWIAKVPASGKIRLLFRNVANASTAIGTISGTMTINGEEYQLVEDTAENFE